MIPICVVFTLKIARGQPIMNYLWCNFSLIYVCLSTICLENILITLIFEHYKRFCKISMPILLWKWWSESFETHVFIIGWTHVKLSLIVILCSTALFKTRRFLCSTMKIPQMLVFFISREYVLSVLNFFICL